MHPTGGEPPPEDFVSQKKWVVVREFLDDKESALFDSVLSTRTLNPDKAVFPLHFACADGDLGAIKKMLEKSHTHGMYRALPKCAQLLLRADCARWGGALALILHLLLGR
jgi:hypothetical protein